MKRWLVASVVLNAVLTLALLGWVAWIVVEPRHWFADAYAAQGPRGEEGPRGDVGPQGPPGPVGPDAEEAVSSLEADISDIESRVTDLEDAASGSELQSQVDDLRSSVEDINSVIGDLCSAISLNYTFSNSATDDLLFDLNNACP